MSLTPERAFSGSVGVRRGPAFLGASLALRGLRIRPLSGPAWPPLGLLLHSVRFSGSFSGRLAGCFLLFFLRPRRYPRRVRCSILGVVLVFGFLKLNGNCGSNSGSNSGSSNDRATPVPMTLTTRRLSLGFALAPFWVPCCGPFCGPACFFSPASSLSSPFLCRCSRFLSHANGFLGPWTLPPRHKLIKHCKLSF